MSGTDDLALAVVGVGTRSHIARYAHRPGAGSRIVACADPSPSAAARARSYFGEAVRSSPDHRDLLDLALDGVFICTPDDTHEQMAVDFLAAGVAVFLEKPMAISVEGCDRILQAARGHRTRLYVGHNMRHMPMVLAMRDLITRGVIGEVQAIWCRHFVGHGGDYYFKDWHADRRRSRSLLLQKGAHDIDVIHWLAGARTRRVSAMGGLLVYGDIDDRQERGDQLLGDWFDPQHNWPPRAQRGLNPVVDVEDLSMVLMGLEGGIFASYQQCHFTPDYWRNYTVIGTEGRLENFGDVEGAEVKVWNRRSDYRAEADLSVPVPRPEGSHGGADPALIEEFLRFARDGGPTATSPVAARDAVAVGCAAADSLRGGAGAVDVVAADPDLAGYFEAGQPGARAGRFGLPGGTPR